MGSVDECCFEVLCVIVVDFVVIQELIGFKFLVECYNLGVLLVIVCNDMVVLEVEGYIIQLYISFGCVFMEKGYCEFVDWFEDVKFLLLVECWVIQSFFEFGVDFDDVLCCVV